MEVSPLKIAIVDDEADMRQSISQWLSLSGFETQTFASAQDALDVIRPGFPGIVISDIKMPGMDGLTLLKHLMHLDSALPVILITGHGDVPMAVEAMHIGAWDFMEKPFNPDKLTELAKKALDSRKTALENRALRSELSDGSNLLGKLAGESDLMVQLRENILDIGQSDAPVLLEGETGTGKTLAARALHAVGPRASKPVLSVVCAAMSDEQQSIELFGAETSELASGKLAEARGGSLILEDVQELGPNSQAQLLAWLNCSMEGECARIISVCNGVEPETKAESRLRPDLYHRLTTHLVQMPPLRQRGDDILQIFVQMMQRAGEEYGCNPPELSAEEAAQLVQAPWPGNLRQLLNMAERAVLAGRREETSLTSLLMADNEAVPQALSQEGKPLKEYVEAFEKMLIDNTMRRHKGSIATVMDELRLPRRTLNEKMAKYGLVRADYL
ncbi:MAG: sigma-54-dependent transcriptional regulator [Mangrovicoccus sp.]